MHYKDESLVNKWKWKIWRKEVTWVSEDRNIDDETAFLGINILLAVHTELNLQNEKL
jgi:hypothetical protein